MFFYNDSGRVTTSDLKITSTVTYQLTTNDSSYISQTILDGNNGLFVIKIENTVGPSTVIMGFTIQNANDGISPHAKFNLLNCCITNCSDGIDYENGSGGICRFNIFENNSDDGIDLDKDVDITIEDNIIRNNGDDGLEIRFHPYNGPLLSNIIRRNTIYGNAKDGIQLIDYGTLSDRILIIEENLIYNNLVGVGCMGDSTSTENFEGASIRERIYLFNNTFSGNPDESGLVYWDVSNIPVGSTIQSVDMTFNVTSKSGQDNYEIYKMNRVWIENEATWNEYASGQSWQVPGANGTADRGSTVLGSIGAPVTGTYTIPLNAAGLAVVQSWVDNPGSKPGIYYFGLHQRQRWVGFVFPREKHSGKSAEINNHLLYLFFHCTREPGYTCPYCFTGKYCFTFKLSQSV